MAVAFYDPDRLLNSDDDTVRNAYDADSDNDGASDGDEIGVGTYPEFADSDCDATATTVGEFDSIHPETQT